MHRVTNSARKLHIRFRITWKHDIAIGYGDGHGAWALKTGYALTVHHPLRNRKTYSCFLISMPELMGMKSSYHLWALHNVRSAQSDLFWCFLGERFFWLLAFTWLWCAVGSSNDKYGLKLMSDHGPLYLPTQCKHQRSKPETACNSRR